MRQTVLEQVPPVGWTAHPRGLQHQETSVVLQTTEQAVAAQVWLQELSGWRVSYDPRCEGIGRLDPWIATSDEQSAISAKTVSALALLAHHAGKVETDYPDIGPDLYDALWLAGWRWSGVEFQRGAESLDPNDPPALLWEATK